MNQAEFRRRNNSPTTLEWGGIPACAQEAAPETNQTQDAITASRQYGKYHR